MLNSRIVSYRITAVHKSRSECETISNKTMPRVIYPIPYSCQNFGVDP